jgi:hypothetical protein
MNSKISSSVKPCATGCRKWRIALGCPFGRSAARTNASTGRADLDKLSATVGRHVSTQEPCLAKISGGTKPVSRFECSSSPAAAARQFQPQLDLNITASDRFLSRIQRHGRTHARQLSEVAAEASGTSSSERPGGSWRALGRLPKLPRQRAPVSAAASCQGMSSS